MKYSVIVASLALGVFAIPQEQSSTITSAPAAPSYSQTPQQSCAAQCDDADVTCKAQCFGVARPNTSQVLETTKCAEECDQGSGSPEDTKKFGDCLQKCYADFFPSSQTLDGGAPGSPASSAGAQGTGTAGEPTGTSNEENPEETGSASESGADGASPSGAANSNKVGLAGAGLAGLALAVFGL